MQDALIPVRTRAVHYSQVSLSQWPSRKPVGETSDRQDDVESSPEWTGGRLYPGQRDGLNGHMLLSKDSVGGQEDSLEREALSFSYDAIAIDTVLLMFNPVAFTSWSRLLATINLYNG